MSKNLQFIECNLVMLPKVADGIDYGARRALICQYGNRVLWWRYAYSFYMNRMSGSRPEPAQLVIHDYDLKKTSSRILHHAGGSLSATLLQAHGDEINKFFGFEVAMDLSPKSTLLVLKPGEELPQGFHTYTKAARQARQRSTLYRVRFEGWHEDGAPKMCSASAFKDGTGWALDRRAEGFHGRFVQDTEADTTPMGAVKRRVALLDKEISKQEKELARMRKQMEQLWVMGDKYGKNLSPGIEMEPKVRSARAGRS